MGGLDGRGGLGFDGPAVPVIDGEDEEERDAARLNARASALTAASISLAEAALRLVALLSAVVSVMPVQGMLMLR